MEIDVELQEGEATKVIENETARIPSHTFLVCSLACMGVSMALKCMGRKHTALFVGQWVAPFLLFGIYNKLVKVAGHDQVS